MAGIDELNPAQKEAVLHTEGPLLVLAGAGAGKTRVVAHRVEEIIRRGAAPAEVLAITFTNKAAREMRERIMSLLPEGSGGGGRPWQEKGPFVSTFHSLGLYILKEHFRAAGLSRLPVVYDRADSSRAIKEALRESGVGEELEPRAALSIISRAKGEGLSAALFAEGAELPRDRAAALVWQKYEKRLQEDGALDFDDLLSRAVALLKKDAAIRAGYQKKWRYVHIDEYQDTNRAQGEMAALLTGAAHNICVVGDIDQTIYSWRGAEIRNILSFEKAYPGAKVVLLEENYRSTKTILAAAHDVISKNTVRVEKNIFTRNEDGDRISLYQAFDENDEAARAARLIDEHLKRGAHPRDFAILYRANFQSRALEEALLAANIPYQVVGTRFFERAEVKDVLALLRLALNRAEGGGEASADIARAINTPPRGIGKVSLLRILSGKERELSPALQGKVAAFRALIGNIAEKARTETLSKVVTFAVKESGIETMLRADKVDGAERLENLRELTSLAARFDTVEGVEALRQFLEGAALASDQDELKEEADAVRLMTVHAAKGLEFPYVFITGLEEGLFPYAREGDDVGDREEERRLMYVALTRAEKKLFLSLCAMRTVFGSQNFAEPSQFLSDISEDLLEMESPERLGKTIYLD